eukprot:jgi/Bigna1/61144/fgenesh1_kg.18_\
MLILAIEKVKEGVLVHYQNLLPIFHPSTESGKQSKEKLPSLVDPVTKTVPAEEPRPRNNENGENHAGDEKISGEISSVPQKRHRVSTSEKPQEAEKLQEEEPRPHEKQSESETKDSISSDTKKTNLNEGNKTSKK